MLNAHPTEYFFRAGRNQARARTLAYAIAVLMLGLTPALLTGCTETADGATNRGGNAPGEWYTARVRSFDLTIAESGQLEASEQVEVKSRVNGRPLIIEVVPEGINVKKGDQLVRLDSAEIEEELASEQLQLESAKADEVSAEQDLAIQINTARSQERAARVALQLAELELAEWEQGNVPTKQRELKLALQKAEREVERATRNFESDQDLFQQRFISQDELEQSEIRTIEAADALATAKLNIDVYEAYTLLKERQQKQSAVDDAEAKLANVIAEHESKLAQAHARAESRRRSRELQEEEITEAEEQLANTVILAPQDGMVVYASSTGNRWNRGEPIAEGRQVRRNETLIVLPDTSQLVAVLSVPEALAPQVQPGQRAEVAVDAIPDEVFSGTVESVSVLAEDGGWWNNNVKNFTVRVMLEPNAGDGRLKPTMTCTGTIFIDRVESAMAVPVQAVFAQGSQRFVYVADGGEVRRQDVRIGRASDTLVEITEGLEAGTEVLLRAPRPGEIDEPETPAQADSNDGESDAAASY